MLELEVIEKCSYILLFGLDLCKSRKGMTAFDGINKVQFFPICGYQIRTVFKNLFPSLNWQFIVGDAIQYLQTYSFGGGDLMHCSPWYGGWKPKLKTSKLGIHKSSTASEGVGLDMPNCDFMNWFQNNVFLIIVCPLQVTSPTDEVTGE